MSEDRTELIKTASRLLAIAQTQQAGKDLTGAEITMLYEVTGNVTKLLQDYTVTGTFPELRNGAGRAATELHKAMWAIENAWIQRWPDNVIILRRTA